MIPAYSTDLSDFIVKRSQCDRFRGEFSGDSNLDNARELNQQLLQYCTGTDQDLARLKKKYHNNPKIIQQLEVYDSNIEPSDQRKTPLDD